MGEDRFLGRIYMHAIFYVHKSRAVMLLKELPVRHVCHTPVVPVLRRNAKYIHREIFDKTDDQMLLDRNHFAFYQFAVLFL